MPLPARVLDDPSFALATFEEKWVYGELYRIFRARPIETAKGADLVGTLAASVRALGDRPRDVLERALPGLRSRELLLERDGVARLKHAPQPKAAKAPGAGVVNDNDVSADEKRLSENRRIAGINWAKNQRAKGDTRSMEELRRHHAERVYTAKPSPLHPVTSPPKPTDVTGRCSAELADVSSVTPCSEEVGGEKESSLSFSPPTSGDSREDVAESRAHATPPADVTATDVTARNTVTSAVEQSPRSSTVEPTARSSEVVRLDLVEPLLRHAEDRFGTADAAMWGRLGDRLAAFGVTRELAEVMGERAAARKLYLQDKYPRMPVGLLIGSRENEGAILARWVDQSKGERDEREQRARDLAPRAGPSTVRVDAPPPQRAVVGAVPTTANGVYIPPWKRPPPKPK